MKTLQLNLKAKWFDMIANGYKTDEYREIKTYYTQRFIDLYCGRFLDTGANGLAHLYYDIYESIERANNSISWRNYDTITFSNGYHKDRRQMVVKLEGIKIGEGLEEWGADKNGRYFVLSIGNIISKNY